MASAAAATPPKRSEKRKHARGGGGSSVAGAPLKLTTRMKALVKAQSGIHVHQCELCRDRQRSIVEAVEQLGDGKHVCAVFAQCDWCADGAAEMMASCERSWQHEDASGGGNTSDDDSDKAKVVAKGCVGGLDMRVDLRATMYEM